MSLEIPENWCDISAKNIVLKGCIHAVYGIYMRVKIWVCVGRQELLKKSSKLFT